MNSYKEADFQHWLNCGELQLELDLMLGEYFLDDGRFGAAFAVVAVAS